MSGIPETPGPLHWGWEAPSSPQRAGVPRLSGCNAGSAGPPGAHKKLRVPSSGQSGHCWLMVWIAPWGGGPGVEAGKCPGRDPKGRNDLARTPGTHEGRRLSAIRELLKIVTLSMTIVIILINRMTNIINIQHLMI